MKRIVIVTITRNEDNVANVSYSNEAANKFRDSAIANELTNMFIAYDDVTIYGTEVDTIHGCRYIIDYVVNNVTETRLTSDELASAYYHAFAPSTIFI